MDVKQSAQTANLIAEASQEWLSACMQPWSILNSLNAFWSDQWKLWLSTVVATPAPWLPALAEEREGQPAVIDFFLPWLPRLDMSGTAGGPVGEKDVVRAMLRAAVPQVGTARTVNRPSGKTETVSRAGGAQEDEPAVRTKPAVRKIAAKSSDVPVAVGPVADAAPEAKVAVAKAKTVKSGKAPVRKAPSAAKKASVPAPAAKDKVAE